MVVMDCVPGDFDIAANKHLFSFECSRPVDLYSFSFFNDRLAHCRYRVNVKWTS